MKKCLVCKLAIVISAIGAINWGLATFDADLVARAFGYMTPGARIVYGLICAMGIISLISTFGNCTFCKKDS